MLDAQSDSLYRGVDGVAVLDNVKLDGTIAERKCLCRLHEVFLLSYDVLLYYLEHCHQFSVSYALIGRR